VRLLITGHSGFVGPYIVQACIEAFPEANVSGLATETSDSRRTIDIDICDRDAVRQFVDDFRPTAVIHLAAISNVAFAFENPIRTWDVNATGSINLFDALQSLDQTPCVISVSTSEVYGRSFNEGPVSETTAMRPMNPYAASKAACDVYVTHLIERGLPYVIARPFNHVGVGQSADFVLPAFAKQIAFAETSGTPVQVGNLDAYRSFLEVESVTAAYITILSNFSKFSGRIVNICAFESIRIGDLLNEMLALSSTTITVEQRAERMRPMEIPRAEGVPSGLLLDEGWQPSFHRASVLKTLLDHARADIASSER